RGLLQRLAHVVRGKTGGVFEEHRHEIGQVVAVKQEPRLGVLVTEIDHRLPALAVVAVNVLEQVQRQRARPVEQFAVGALQVEKVLLLHRVEQWREAYRSEERRVGKEGRAWWSRYRVHT